jgi:2-desacetyl-2-hydroxyethyl bacteriochlorophyllide A dehydrogenase
MQQIILQEPRQFARREVDEPAPQAGQALVRVHRIGICGTDLHAFTGRQPYFRYPRVLGHELGVEVLSAPQNDRDIQPGDRCCVEPYMACGQCYACGKSKPNCCENIRVMGVHADGGMQPVYAVPVHLLHKSEKLSLDQLALVEPLGIGAHAVARSQLQPGETALIVGAGAIGLASLQFALAQGAKVRVLEVSPSRREFVARLGVETLAEPDAQLADVVIDATGNRQAMQGSFERVAPGGRLVFVGIVQDEITFHDPLFHRREMTLLASRNSIGVFPKIIRMIEQGQIDTAPWITHRMRLADVPREFDAVSRQPNLLKAMIEVE